MPDRDNPTQQNRNAVCVFVCVFIVPHSDTKKRKTRYRLRDNGFRWSC